MPTNKTKNKENILKNSNEAICRICNSNNKNIFLNVKVTGENKYDYFDYLFCDTCNSLTIVDIPLDLDKYYEGYYSQKPFDTKNKIRCFLFRNKVLYRIFNKFFLRSIFDYNLKSLMHLNLKKSDKILDIGSGSGKFVFDLHNLGFFNSVGIDPYLPESINYKNGAVIYKKKLSQIKEKYKLITFHHTFEHMNNLSEVCNQIATLLESQGICIIRLPNIDSFAFKRFREFWTGIHAPFHINLPSKKAMEKMLEVNGLEIKEIRGEQTSAFFLASVENQLNVINPDTMFIKFSEYCHIFLDKIYWIFKAYKVKKYPERCEWVVYYIRKK